MQRCAVIFLMAAMSVSLTASYVNAQDDLSDEEMEIIESMEFLEMLDFLESEEEVIVINKYENFDELYSEVENE